MLRLLLVGDYAGRPELTTTAILSCSQIGYESMRATNSRFVDTEKDSLILPIPTAAILEFFLHIGNGGYIDVDSDSEVEVAESVTKDDCIKDKAVSSIGGYRSAIIALSKEQHISHLLPRDELSEFLSGYKRTIADEKPKGTCHSMKESIP